jgi:hypothetical protein
MTPWQIAFQILLAGVTLEIALSAPREYLFFGPTVSGRFVVEEQTIATPGTDPASLQLNFTSSPYLFSSSLPHDLAAYNGVHFVRLAGTDHQITSLTPVPEPSLYCFVLVGIGFWILSRARKVTIRTAAVSRRSTN